jgi:hypothetical protein
VRYIILCLLPLTLFAADLPSAKPLPVGVDPIVKEYQDAVAKARAAYEAACAKAQEKALAALEAKNKEIIKKGDVDGAIAVKGVIEKVKTGKVREEVEREVGLLGVEKKPLTVPGTYKVISGGWAGITSIVLDEKKNAKATDGATGVWSLKDGLLIITWNNGNTNKAKLSNEAMVMVGDRGASVTLIKEE